MAQLGSYASPRSDFDPGLRDELDRWESAAPIVPVSLEGPNPFGTYTRTLSARGGLLITYQDKAVGVFLDALRVFTLPVAVGLLAWLLFVKASLSLAFGVTLFLLGAVAIAVIVLHPIPVAHSIEIYPDGMTVDGRHFYVEHMGDNWPTLQMADGADVDRFVLRGIYGTRLVEYATVNRWDTEADRTVERLAQDLNLAMQQLWGRRDDMAPEA